MGNKQDVEEIFHRKYLEEQLRAEFESSLEMRIQRTLETKPQWIRPVTHFAPVLHEVIDLYRNGYFYGCISLAQAVVEALARFICKKDNGKHAKDFSINVSRMKDLSRDIKEDFRRIWGKDNERNDFHHLNITVERDRKKLELIAKEKVALLIKIEKEIFACEIREGKIVSWKYPKYWNLMGNKALVHLWTGY